MDSKASQRRFGIDPATGRLHLGKWHMPLPRSRVGRITIGSGLVVGGVLGFLPILGFWMVPLGLVVLSQDLSIVRRKRRQVAVWWMRRKAERRKR